MKRRSPNLGAKRSAAAVEPILIVAAPSKRSRSRVVPLAAVLVAAALLLVIRVATRHPSEPERLFLNDEVVLTAPPPLPESDIRFLQLQFHRLQAYRISADQHPQNAAEQLEYANAALQARDPIEALGAYRRAIRLTPSPGADLYYNLGHAQDMLGLGEDALATYQQMIHAYPLDGRGYLQESLTYELLSRPPDEAKALESGLAALPATDVAGRIPLANQFDVNGDTGRALAEAQAIRNQNPTDARAIIAVADLLIKSQRIQEALPMIADLLAHEPTNHHAHYEMGVILASPSVLEHNDAAAEHELLTAARQAPDNKDYLRRLGELYQDQGRWRQCAYIALQLLTTVPGNAVGRQFLAQSLAHLGDRAGAAEQSAIASSLIAEDMELSEMKTRLFTHPTDVKANIALARRFEKYGQFSNALMRAESAYTLAPTNREARAVLEDLCARIGISPPSVSVLESKHL